MNNFIIRKIINKKHKYFNNNNIEIKNYNIINKYLSKPIAPAYNPVIIYTNSKNNIYAKCLDKKGRWQYIYRDHFIKSNINKKYCSLIKFIKKKEIIYNKVKKDIESNNIEERNCALVINILFNCPLRVGNEKYHELYGSVGISSLRKENMNINEEGINLEFKGKKGVINQCFIRDDRLIRILRNLYNMKRGKETPLFHDEKSNIKITGDEINNYLNQFGDITSKNIRTYFANDLFLNAIKKLNYEEKESKRKKVIKEAIKSVSEVLYNTPAICKKNYISEKLLEYFMNGEENIWNGVRKIKDNDKFLMKILKNYCK
jgi:DNA topoisomerase I